MAQSSRVPPSFHCSLLIILCCRICLGGCEERADQCEWQADFDDGHGNVRLVDSFNGNLLLRTSWPYGTTSEKLGCLEREMRRAAGDLWPEKPFDIIDVGLAEEVLFEDEEAFGPEHVLKYPSVNYRNFGKSFQAACSNRTSELGVPASQCPASMQPGSTSPEVKDFLAGRFEEWEGDSLDNHVAKVRALLTQKGRRIIFFHCASGKDRTGEFFAAYAIRYMNMSFTEAWAKNVQVARRMTIYAVQIAAQWYCEYLRKHGLYAFDDCSSCEEWPVDALDSFRQCYADGQLQKETVSSECQAILDRFKKPLCTEDPPKKSVLISLQADNPPAMGFFGDSASMFLVAVAFVCFILVSVMLIWHRRQIPHKHQSLMTNMIA